MSAAVPFNTTTAHAADVIRTWPDPAREAAQAVIDRYGEPAEATESELIWRRAGPWKRLVAQRTAWDHRFPAPHTDSIQAVVDYHVPVEKISYIAQFDGSVSVERTSGELMVRCHDEAADLLALNLADDIVAGRKTVQDARDYYVKEFLDARRHQPTPYMRELRFTTRLRPTDPDDRVLSDSEIKAAQEEGARAPD